ncbi:MAG: phenylalanine--tRNA ligase subunit alpha, partial [Candidatus Uhrbacteria bacterium]|nr:phenylalanine--tRNA ligase subunit alpha [Candidatus Uhrbacteria bacterium]
RLTNLSNEARAAIKKAEALEVLEALEVRFVGRKGELTALLKNLADVPAGERPVIGTLANEIKLALERDIAQKRAGLRSSAVSSALEKEREDVTEPGIAPPQGHLHIVSQAIHDIEEIFAKAGFVRVRYPEVEWDLYAFEHLNMPPDHPARDEWETFFCAGGASASGGMDVIIQHPKTGKMILTPHATSGTARILEEMAPALKKGDAIRAINIAKTYRRQIDVTHVPMFHQFDGVYVDKGVNLTHLLGILDYFVKHFFGPDRTVRIRPFHFRFTEPSFEVDVSCGVCGGTGFITPPAGGGVGGGGSKCRACKNGWVEIGGAGMLHPNVLKAAKIDPETYSGLAFGWGIERTYMMKEGLQLDDLRTLYKNDLRFLQQF